jgi:hypothetical protein
MRIDNFPRRIRKRGERKRIMGVDCLEPVQKESPIPGRCCTSREERTWNIPFRNQKDYSK